MVCQNSQNLKKTHGKWYKTTFGSNIFWDYQNDI